MSRARTWVKWIQFGAIALVVGSIAAEFVLGDQHPDVFAAIERAFMLLVVGVVGFGVLALGWQALSDLTRSPTEGVTGPVEVALVQPRTAAWVVIAILLTGGTTMAWWLFAAPADDQPFPPMDAWDTQAWLIAGLFTLIWAVLLLGFLTMAVRRAPWFVLTPRGFLYAPGGMSPGFVRWEDVTTLRETEIVSARTRAKPTTERVLAVGLRDPAKYSANYNPMLGALVRLGGKLYEAQTEGPADILINPTDFGDQYDAILARMIALHAEAQR